jgi:NADH:quinone reductase (non-electrogenic)
MVRTRITELLGINAPILQGGMQWIGYADLAAAVSNAGGLGLITALSHDSPRHLFEEIRRCHDLTDRPFGVNLTMLPAINPPPYDDFRDAAIAGGVEAVETSGSNPAMLVERFHDAGAKVMHKATSIKHALKAQDVGVDAVIIDGFECAGHPGEDDVPGLVLIPATVDALSIPVVAAGGIADGRGLMAALSLGAEGVVLGTRLMATAEARIHQKVKGAIVAGDERSTQLIFRELRNTARVARNGISEHVTEILRGGGQFDDVRHLVAGLRGRTVYESGDLEAGIWWAGLSQALIHDIPTCDELIERMMAEAVAIIEGRLWAMALPPVEVER